MLIIVMKVAINIARYLSTSVGDFSPFFYFYKNGFQNRISLLKVTELFKQEHKVKLRDSCLLCTSSDGGSADIILPHFPYHAS